MPFHSCTQPAYQGLGLHQDTAEKLSLALPSLRRHWVSWVETRQRYRKKRKGDQREAEHEEDMKRTLENGPAILPDLMLMPSACPDSHWGRGFCKSNILRSPEGIHQRQVSPSRSHPMLLQLRPHHFFPAPEKPASSPSTAQPGRLSGTEGHHHLSWADVPYWRWSSLWAHQTPALHSFATHCCLSSTQHCLGRSWISREQILHITITSLKLLTPKSFLGGHQPLLFL